MKTFGLDELTFLMKTLLSQKEKKISLRVIKPSPCKASKHLDDDFLTLDNGTSEWPSSYSWLSSHPWSPSRLMGDITMEL